MNNVAAFFDDLQHRIDIGRDYREKLNRLVAHDFNLIDFILPDELRMSRLIAFLLDPRAAHGQGTTFLQAFLDRLVPMPVASVLKGRLNEGQKVVIRLEESTRKRRRIDIVVSIGQAAIGIENKPWAADQLLQLEDYASDLKARYSNWALIYVRGYSGSPGEEVLSAERRRQLTDEGHYIEWWYASDVAEWVGTCVKVCEADKMRWLLRDFHAYVRSTFKLAVPQGAGNAE